MLVSLRSRIPDFPWLCLNEVSGPFFKSKVHQIVLLMAKHNMSVKDIDISQNDKFFVSSLPHYDV